MNPALLAAARAASGIGSASTGALLGLESLLEKTGIAESSRRLFESGRASAEAAQEQAADVNIGRLLLGGAGLLLGGVPGAFIGSLAGQFAGKRGRKRPQVSAGETDGMFYAGTRKKISQRAEDINRFIDRANESFGAQALFTSINDAFLANQALTALPGLKAAPSLLKAGVTPGVEAGFSFRDLFKYRPQTTTPLLDMPGLERLTTESFQAPRIPLGSPRTAVYGTQGDFSGTIQDLIRSLRG